MSWWDKLVDTVTSRNFDISDFSDKFQFKIEEIEENTNLKMYGVFGKGNPKVKTTNSVALIFKLYDKETACPILSSIEEASENGSRVFEHYVSIGNLANKYYPDWTRFSFLVPDALIGPYRGTRKLELDCYVWEEANRPAFQNGFLPQGSDYRGAINIVKHEFDFYFSSAGYLEIDEEKLKIQEVSIKLALSIALADGSFDATEGNEIKKWIKEIVDSSLDSKKDEIKNRLNNALEEGYKDLKENKIDVKKLCSEIINIGDKAYKYDLLELCLDVMAADGEADKNELKVISEISTMIGVDYDEVNKLKDQRLIKLDPEALSDSGLEDILGIDPDWDNETIKKHLMQLFNKYNGRLNQVSEGPERKNAQIMIDKIAEARQKYS